MDTTERAATAAEERFWLLDQLDPGSQNVGWVDEIEGPLEPAALEAALDALVRRHEILATEYVLRDGALHARVRPGARAALLPGAAPDPAALEADARRPLATDSAPLVRVTLHRLSERRHLLAFVVHHVLIDGETLNYFREDLYEAYARMVQQGGVAPEPAPPYSAHAAREASATERTSACRTYWLTRLGGAPSRVELPADGAPLARGRLARLTATPLAPELLARVASAARGLRCTTFAFALAAYAALLARLSGQSDLVIGIAASGRAGRDAGRMAGPLANPIAVRVDVEPAARFADFALVVRNQLLEAKEHEDYPFSRVVQDLARAGDRRMPFNVMFGMPPPEPAECLVAGLAVRQSSVFHQREGQYDLSVMLVAEAGGHVFHAQYRADVFERARVEALLDQLTYILEQVSADPALPLARLSLAPPRARALHERLADPLPTPPPPDLIELVRGPAEHPGAATGSRAAIVWPGGDLAPDALAQRTRALETALASAGVGPGQVVAVAGPPSPGVVAAWLAVLGRGASVLPVDAAEPPARLAMVLERAHVAAAVLVDGARPEALDALPCRVTLAADATAPRVERAAPTMPAPWPADAGYVMSTSGTTGEPRIVMGSRSALAQFIDWQRRTFAIGSCDRVSWLTRVTFDPVLRDVLLPAAAGATLAIPPRGPADPGVLTWLRDARVTVVHAVPALAASWLQHAPPGLTLPDLRLTFFAGEPLTGALVRAWRRVAEDCRVVNLYGPTETTLARSWHEVADPPADGVQPVGSALPGSALVVLDDAGALCGCGEEGDLVVRTRFPSLGLVTARGLDASLFVREPGGAVRYVTGDRGRFRPDGSVEIRRRHDGQLKVRGVRVTLSEVEACLAAHPAVRAAAVRPSEQGGATVLVAWLVAADVRASDAELRRHVADRVPAAAVPAVFTWIAELPLTAHGKLDAARLPAPAPALVTSPAPVDPTDQLEDALVTAFEFTLDRRPLGVDDDFFALGGDSLAAARLVAGLDDWLDRRVPMALLFDAPSPRLLARALRTEVGPAAWRPLVPIQPAGDRPTLFAVHPADGHVMGYRELGRHLAPDQPLVAIQARGLDGRTPPHVDVAAMAADYLREVRARQPAGPYHLLGWSGGGVIAYEMARQLSGAGDEVGSLVLVETHFPGTAADKSLAGRVLATPGRWARRALRHVSRLAALPPARWRPYIASRLSTLVDRAAAPPLPTIDILRRIAGELSRAYIVEPYAGDMLYVHSEAGPPGGDSPWHGWRLQVRGRFELRRLPGDHFSLLRAPVVSQLASLLRDWIDRAGRPGSARPGDRRDPGA